MTIRLHARWPNQTPTFRWRWSLLVGDPAQQLRCRDELAERDDHLPRWITALPQLEAYRAVRRTHVLGDVDELVIGARLNGGHELTVAVPVDHNNVSTVADAGVVRHSIDRALVSVAEGSSDTTIVDMSLADARGWIERVLTRPTFTPETDTRPKSCVTASSHPRPRRRAVTSAIESC